MDWRKDLEIIKQGSPLIIAVDSVPIAGESGINLN